MREQTADPAAKAASRRPAGVEGGVSGGAAPLRPTQQPPGPLLGRSFEGGTVTCERRSGRGVRCLGGPGLATGTYPEWSLRLCREHVR